MILWRIVSFTFNNILPFAVVHMNSLLSNMERDEFGCNKHETFEDLMEFYKEAASVYDKDVKANRGYVGPETGAEILANTLKQFKFSEDARILDVGAGTGLVGEELVKRKFINIDALDASEAILKEAEKKGVYKSFFVDVLGPNQRLQMADNCYDAAIAVGVFTLNHVKAEGAFDEMARVVRSGGLVCFTIREDVMFEEEYGYQNKMDQLCRDKVWKLVSQSKEQYHVKNDCMKCFVYIYQVL
ncbi:methyltransferase-like protein 27 isoform X2 [Oculina patagonica]